MFPFLWRIDYLNCIEKIVLLHPSKPCLSETQILQIWEYLGVTRALLY